MKQYKLLKDLPTFKAGDLFYISKDGDLKYEGLNYKEIADSALLGGGLSDTGIVAYAKQTLEKFPEILTEWFEEIQELTDSIHWKPKKGEIYWFIGIGGKTNHDFWTGTPADFWRYGLGKIYRTKEECEKARDRELAKARLRRTSTFEPDFALGYGGYSVCCDHAIYDLRAHPVGTIDNGEIVRYETMEDAQKSIKENREDWLIYFGIEEEE